MSIMLTSSPRSRSAGCASLTRCAPSDGLWTLGFLAASRRPFDDGLPTALRTALPRGLPQPRPSGDSPFGRLAPRGPSRARHRVCAGCPFGAASGGGRPAQPARRPLRRRRVAALVGTAQLRLPLRARAALGILRASRPGRRRAAGECEVVGKACRPQAAARPTHEYARRHRGGHRAHHRPLAALAALPDGRARAARGRSAGEEPSRVPGLTVPFAALALSRASEFTSSLPWP